MTEPAEDHLLMALQHLAEDHAAPHDQDLIRQAMLQSGGVNLGQDNEVSIAGSVIGSLNLGNLTHEQFLAMLQRLFPETYQPEKPAAFDRLPEPGALPPGSRLPFNRNAIFTGRNADLLDLGKHLLDPQQLPSGMMQAVAVTGEAGLGKTQLAVEFCYRYGRFFHGVHWLQMPPEKKPAGEPAEEQTRGHLLEEIAACGVKMGLKPWPEALADQVKATLSEWERIGPRLVVWDNIEDEALVQEWLPQLGQVRLLLSSRRHLWPQDMLSTLPLESLKRPQSLELLRKLASRLKHVSDAQLDQVADQLGDLPLALDLAGRYLSERRGLDVQEFLQELEETGGALGHSALVDWTTHNPTRHDTNLAASFLLSWKQVASLAARQLFFACGYCSPNTPIPWDVFYRLAGASGEAEVDRQLGGLENLGLLRLVEMGVVTHPLLAEFARLQDCAAPSSALPALAGCLAELAEQANDSGLPASFEPLRAHVESAAGWATRNKLELAGRLWNANGYHLVIVAEYPGAKASFERALAIDEATFGTHHPDVARDVNDLGEALRLLGDYPAAIAAYQRSLGIWEKIVGPDHPQVATVTNNLGLVYQALGDYAAARSAYERALAIDEAALGPHHPDVARDVNDLGESLRLLGDYPAARAAYQRALAIDEAVYGPDHPNVARDINNLGLALEALGDIPAARGAFERALAIWEKTLGPDHPQVAIGLNNLGEVFRLLGDYPSARSNLERSLAIWEKTLGPNSSQVAIGISNLGIVLLKTGDHSAGKAAFARALAIDEAAFGPDHPEVARDLHNISTVLRDLGDYTAAKEASTRSLAILLKHLPPDHPSVQIVKGNLDNLQRAIDEQA